MTLDNKVRARCISTERRYHRKATGIVVDVDTHHALYKEFYDRESRTRFLPAEYQSDTFIGGTYMGLEVSISRHKGTLVVY